MDDYIAVSYTHLDVYKRQKLTLFELYPLHFKNLPHYVFIRFVKCASLPPYSYLNLFILFTLFTLASLLFIPVSYTHLDVYKRQLLCTVLVK